MTDYAIPDNYNVGKLAASIVLPGNILVYGFTVYSSNAAAQFLTLHDGGKLPANGAVPLISWPLAATNGVGFSWAPNGRCFANGLVLANSSTSATLTIGAADCLFDVQYEALYIEPGGGNADD